MDSRKSKLDGDPSTTPAGPPRTEKRFVQPVSQPAFSLPSGGPGAGPSSGAGPLATLKNQGGSWIPPQAGNFFGMPPSTGRNQFPTNANINTTSATTGTGTYQKTTAGGAGFFNPERQSKALPFRHNEKAPALSSQLPKATVQQKQQQQQKQPAAPSFGANRQQNQLFSKEAGAGGATTRPFPPSNKPSMFLPQPKHSVLTGTMPSSPPIQGRLGQKNDRPASSMLPPTGQFRPKGMNTEGVQKKQKSNVQFPAPNTTSTFPLINQTNQFSLPDLPEVNQAVPADSMYEDLFFDSAQMHDNLFNNLDANGMDMNFHTNHLPAASTMFEFMTNDTNKMGTGDLDAFMEGNLIPDNANLRGQKRQRDHPFTLQSMGPNALPKVDNLSAMAVGLNSSLGDAKLHEPDDFIVATEKIVKDITRDNADVSAQQLLALWDKACPKVSVQSLNGIGLGFDKNAAPLGIAEMIASLAISVSQPTVKLVVDKGNRSRLARPRSSSQQTVPVPEVLLKWLKKYHDSLSEQVSEFAQVEGRYSENPLFWEFIPYLCVRGEFNILLTMLRGANFAVAMTNFDSHGPSPIRYTEHELVGINNATDAVIRLIEQCPAVVSGNWEIPGPEWNLFRQSARQLSMEIKMLGLPTEVDDMHRDILSVFIGVSSVIMGTACDWLEGVLYLTIWWNGDGENDFRDSLRLSRRPYHERAQSMHKPVAVDLVGYQRRLLFAFNHVSTDTAFQLLTALDPSDLFQIGIACAINQQSLAVVQILKSVSLVVAAAVAEVGRQSGWLITSSNNDLGALAGLLSAEDLKILEYGHNQGQKQPSAYDELLNVFSEQLFKRESVGSHDGWQLALGVISRLEDQAESENRIKGMLEKVDTSTPGQLDALLTACHSLGKEEYAQQVAGRHAERMLGAQEYGLALLYYARARNEVGVRDVLDQLCCRSLIQSKAFPVRSRMDSQLRQFIDAPRATLSKISQIDYNAAQLLSSCLSGYATIRLFYRLRDAEIDEKDLSGRRMGGPQQNLRRLREAGTVLLACIQSAGDCISGGLYDPAVHSVVHVDCLLPLLGEALVLVSQPRRVFDAGQLASLLRVVEDLETVSSNVFNQSNELLKTALRNYLNPRAAPAAPAGDATASEPPLNPFRPGASVFRTQPDILALDAGGAAELAPLERGWDWRRGLVESSRQPGAGATLETSVDGHDLVGVIRVILARELSRAWAAGDVAVGGVAVATVGVKPRSGAAGEAMADVIAQRISERDGDVFKSQGAVKRGGLFA